MSHSSLVQGRILGDIQTRPPKTGGQITFFKMQVISGTTKELWSISTFSDAVREELSSLRAGDAVSVVGMLHAEISNGRVSSGSAFGLQPIVRWP
jgi:hypothetical protein